MDIKKKQILLRKIDAEFIVFGKERAPRRQNKGGTAWAAAHRDVILFVGRGLAPAEIQYIAYGRIAQEQLLLLEQRYPSLKIDQYVIMPNHIHAIRLFGGNGGSKPPPYNKAR